MVPEFSGAALSAILVMIEMLGESREVDSWTPSALGAHGVFFTRELMGWER
jgi:hypothetical protein